MSPQKDRRELNIVLVPAGDGETRNFTVSYRALRAVGALSGLAVVGGALLVFSFWPLASRAARVAELENELVAMGRDLERVEALVERLDRMEARYLQVRSMFGAGSRAGADSVWLLPPLAQEVDDEARRPGAGTPPSFWPLEERGFVTQGLHAGAEDAHPGLDIAVPSGSSIRAAGSGRVADVGEDVVYGRFVVVDHGGGIRTLYAHASSTLVQPGQEVSAREVVALSGSTGRSTAPHLHFEVIVDGLPVDPLAFVEQPR